MTLTKTQRNAARSLFICRPRVLEGTRVIPDDKARKEWYDKVNDVMTSCNVKPVDVERFCDIAGVPD